MKLQIFSLVLFIGIFAGSSSDVVVDSKQLLNSDEFSEMVIVPDVIKSLHSASYTFEEIIPENSFSCEFGTCSCRLIVCTNEGTPNETCWEEFETCMCTQHEVCEHS